MDDLMDEAERKFKKAVEVTAQEFGSIRTGRASPALVERLQVSYYGAPTPLNQIASLSAPEPRMLVIQPYDRNSIPDIEKAITQSDLGLVPSDDGEVIRLPVPQLTEERRRELSKLVKVRAEEGEWPCGTSGATRIKLCAMRRRRVTPPRTTSTGDWRTSRSSRTNISKRLTSSWRRRSRS